MTVGRIDEPAFCRVLLFLRGKRNKESIPTRATCEINPDIFEWLCFKREQIWYGSIEPVTVPDGGAVQDQTRDLAGKLLRRDVDQNSGLSLH